MDPHFGVIGHAQAIAEILVAAFVNDDVIPVHISGDHTAQVAALIHVAVGDAALVLHAEVGGLDHGKTVFPKGIFVEIMLVAGQHRPHLRELLPGFIQVVAEHVIIQREHVAVQRGVGIAEMRKIAHGERHVVIIDRITHEPIVGHAVFTGRFFTPQIAVAHGGECFGYRDGEAQAIRLVAEVVFVGPPQAGPGTFAGHADPRIVEFILLPHKAAVPGGVLGPQRLSVVVQGKRDHRTHRRARRQADKHRIAVALEGQGFLAPHHPIELHVFKEVYLDAIGGFHHGEVHLHRTRNGLRFQIEVDIDVIVLYVEAGALGAQRAA